MIQLDPQILSSINWSQSKCITFTQATSELILSMNTSDLNGKNLGQSKSIISATSLSPDHELEISEDSSNVFIDQQLERSDTSPLGSRSLAQGEEVESATFFFDLILCLQ